MSERAKSQPIARIAAKAIRKTNAHPIFNIDFVRELLVQFAKTVRPVKDVPHGFGPVDAEEGFGGKPSTSISGGGENTVSVPKHHEVHHCGRHQFWFLAAAEGDLPERTRFCHCSALASEAETRKVIGRLRTGQVVYAVQSKATRKHRPVPDMPAK
jgi:hypothetical protein